MIELTAPAKINLTLEVLGRREDGYHAIASIMHRLSLHDTLILTPYDAFPPESRIRLEVEGFAVPTDERNLVWRALELVGALRGEPSAEPKPQLAGEAPAEPHSRSVGVPPTKSAGWHVRLIKRIPTEAGLGGGSSDAAAILRYFSSSLQRVQEIALQLGSDVPFFLNGACARVEGRGEQVKPLPPLTPFWWALAKPMEVGVPTAWAYAQLKRPPHKAANPTGLISPTERLEQAILRGAIRTPEALATLLHNDFEAVVLPAFEPLQRLRARMEALGALRVLLCGSGAAQAALCTSQAKAEQIANALRTEGYWAVATQFGL